MRRRIKEIYRDVKYLKFKIPRLTVRPTDCFLHSWPRSGNTWMRYMICYALFPDEEWGIAQIEQMMPIVDCPEFKKLLRKMDNKPYRLFKSHEPFQPYFLDGRNVYIVRHGLDSMASHYHYKRNMNKLTISSSLFMAHSLTGQYRHGAWHEHVQGWMRQESHPSMLVIRYEQIIENPRRELIKVLNHFGISVSDQRINQAVERATIDRVNKGFQDWAADKSRWFSGGLGGGSGKGRKVFTEKDIKVFEQYAGEILRQLEYTL